MAASVMALLPILILFVFMQKHFVRGIVMTGIKG
jgi:multiple sugar transport system permease protein